MLPNLAACGRQTIVAPEQPPRGTLVRSLRLPQLVRQIPTPLSLTPLSYQVVPLPVV